VFNEMLNRNLISWTELISAYANSGNMESVEELFDELFYF
jgi:pentatricopeptide repeat protein